MTCNIIADFTISDGFYHPRIFKQKRKRCWESLIPVQKVRYVNTPKYSFGIFLLKKSTCQNASDKQQKMHLDSCEKYISKEIKDV